MMLTANHAKYANGRTGPIRLWRRGSFRVVGVFRGCLSDRGCELIGQLQVANSSINSEDRGYTYDAAWNLNWRTNSGVLQKFSVDGKNQLTNAWVSGSSGGPNLGFDANGNLIWESSAGLFTRNYDAENRLVQAYVGGGGAPPSSYHQFAYDGLGRLRKTQSYAWNGMGYTLSGETQYIYDGWRVIQERNSSGTPVVSYTRGTDLSGSMEGAGGIGGLLGRSHGYSSGNWSTHSYYHADGNGNITYMLNAGQSMVASYKYDAYGNTLASSGSLAGANVYRFSSKERVPVQDIYGSELYYYGYRFYEPALQRWLNRDPIRELGFEALRARYTRKGKPTRGDGDNLYKFVDNSPISQWDYLGLDNPGCDFPATSLPCILPGGPGAADCYLRCCAQHDVCFHDNHCKALTAWPQIFCPTKCGGCGRQALNCFANCPSGATGPGNPPYYCAANDSYYYNWDDIPPSCWEGGIKPKKPDCYP